MTSPLVATKLFVPRLRSSAVDRTRLTSRLRARAEAKLTLVSAPAGFGKTTTVTAWLAGSTAEQRAVAWVSLDAGDEQARPSGRTWSPPCTPPGPMWARASCPCSRQGSRPAGTCWQRS